MQPVLHLERFDARARAALAAAQARADASGHIQVTVLHVLRALIGAEAPARAFEARGGDVARAIAASDAELAKEPKATPGGLSYLSVGVTKILERLSSEPDTLTYERLLDACLAFGAAPIRGEAERVHRVRGASGMAPVAPTPPALPPETTVVTLDSFTAGARRAFAAAQKLADDGGHVHTTFVHLIRALLDCAVVQSHVRSRRGDPTRAIEAAELELATEPKRRPNEQSFLSSTANTFLQAHLKASGETSLIALLHGCVTTADTTPAMKRIVEAGGLGACTAKLAHPAPRLFAMRSAERGNARDALDALEELGDISSEPPLLVARIRSNVLVDKIAAAEADFVTLTGQSSTTIDELRQAHKALARKSSSPNAPSIHARLLSAVLDRMPPEPTEGMSPLRSFVQAIPLAEWPIEALFRLVEDTLLDRDAFSSNSADVARLLEGIHARAAGDPRTATLARRFAQAKEDAENARVGAQKERAAARPDFDAIEAAFEAKLPPALRRAWQAHFDGDTIGFGFYAPLNGQLEPLLDLAKRLTQQRGQAPVLPFALGEHEDDYFALDLGWTTSGAVDYPVLLFAGGDHALAYPSSAAWLAADGMPKY